jgi:hypothetical protein
MNFLRLVMGAAGIGRRWTARMNAANCEVASLGVRDASSWHGPFTPRRWSAFTNGRKSWGFLKLRV